MNETVMQLFDFPEDEFPKDEEVRVKDRLIEKLMAFAGRFFGMEMQKAMELFAPPGLTDLELITDGVKDSLMLNFFEWFLFDADVDPDRVSTVTDIFLWRKKLNLSRREKDIIEMMRQSRIDLYEIREVHPGRGLVLRRLTDGDEFPVVEMKASRQLTCWSLIACRIWTLDGVRRLSAGLYVFEPERRPFLEKLIKEFRKETAKLGSPPDHFRRGFSTLICQQWLEPTIHPRMPKLRNRDGNRLVFCSARFRTDDRAALHRDLIGQKKILTEEDGPDQIVWLSGKRDEAGGRTIIGTFLWKGDELTFEANSLRRYNRGLKVLKKLGGDGIQLIEESKKPVEKLLAEEPPDFGNVDESVGKIPSAMDSKIMLEIKQAYYKGWLKKPIPALLDKTPLQAVRSSAGRRQVAELLKGIERSEEESRLRGEPALDMAFLWEGLGLDPEDF